MKTNDVFFSGSRFGYLLKKEWMEDIKKNIMRFVVVFGIFLVLFLFYGFNDYHQLPSYTRLYDRAWDFILPLFVIGIFLGACMSATYITEKMKNKTGKLSAMMLPATTFEKFFVRWLMYCVGFVVLYLLAFKLADWVRVLIFSNYFTKENIQVFPVFKIISVATYRSDVTEMDEQVTPIIISVYFALQSFFVLGSTLWQKNSFLKTAVTLILVIAGLCAIAYFSVKLFIPHNFILDISDEYKPTPEVGQKIVITFFYAITLFNTVLAYFRYKEMEIINRW